MGTLDAAMRNVLQHREYFADICNMLLFQGEQLILPESLQTMDSVQQILVSEGETGKKKDSEKSISRTRDSVYEAGIMMDEHRAYVILGVEHQSQLDISMPVRNLMYDAMQLNLQVRQISEKRDGDRTKERFLSPMNHEDRLKPVITMILYTGEEPWEFPLSLQDVMDMRALPEALWGYTPNLKLLVLDVKHSTELNLLHSYLQQVFTAAQYTGKGQSRSLQEYIGEQEAFRHLPGTLKVLAGCLLNLNETDYLEEGDDNMCEALEEMREECLLQGQLQGQLQANARMVLNVMRNMKLSASEAFALLGIYEEEQAACLEQMERIQALAVSES